MFFCSKFSDIHPDRVLDRVHEIAKKIKSEQQRLGLLW
jgi:hypothetical protein